MAKQFHIVMMPIKVPNNVFCWYRDPGNSTVCPSFINSEGGHPRCTLGIYIDPGLQVQDGSVYKPVECLMFKEDKDE